MKKIKSNIFYSSKLSMLFLSMLFFTAILAGCSGTGSSVPNQETTKALTQAQTEADKQESLAETPTEKTSWAIYWYLCGSDLERDCGSASADLEELLSVPLPEDVKVIIETGGSSVWKKEGISEEVIERYLYDADGFRKIAVLEDANMGEADTLADFMTDCLEMHPAEHSMLLMWDHGGGALGGIAYDERYNMDNLDALEQRVAFAAAADKVGTDQKLFDIVGFDACLMSNITTVQACAPYADYMIASEETESLYGWNYAGIANALAGNPKLEPKELGIAICDSFISDLKEKNADKDQTLALIELQNSETMLENFRICGSLLLIDALSDDSAVASIRRGAKSTEAYGTNSDGSFTNMVDLGSLLFTTMDFLITRNEQLQETEKMDEAIYYLLELMHGLESMVVYQVRGEARPEGMGISCYYPLDENMRSLVQFKKASGEKSFDFLYQYLLTGNKDENILEYIHSMGYDADEDLREHITIQDLHINEIQPQLEGDGPEIQLNIDTSKLSYISAVSGSCTLRLHGSDFWWYLGSEICTDADWESGTFRFELPTQWWYLNNTLVCAFLWQETEDTALYGIPIQYNGVNANLKMLYHKADQTAEILGISPYAGEDYMQPKTINEFRPEDVITVMMGIIYDNDAEEASDGVGMFPFKELTVGTGLSIEKNPLPECRMYWQYDVYDGWGNLDSSKLMEYEIYN